MSDQAAATPSPEHEKLQSKIGVWDVDCFYSMNLPEPVQAKGRETIEALGAFWTVGRFEVELHGSSILGRSTLGWDPHKLAYIGTWMDSATPFFYYFEGHFDEAGTVLKLEGDNTDPISKNLVLYRSEEEYSDNDHRVLSLFVESKPGFETQLLRYEYTRIG